MIQTKERIKLEFKPIPGFDSLKMKEEIQAAIFEETKHMTLDKRREYIRQGAAEFDAEIQEIRTARLAAEAAGKQESETI